jgi:hypothetical protein
MAGHEAGSRRGLRLAQGSASHTGTGGEQGGRVHRWARWTRTGSQLAVQRAFAADP